MRRTLVSAAVLTLFATLAGAANTDDELIALDKQWAESVMKGDVAAAEKMLGDHMVSVTEEGIGGRQDEIAGYKMAPAGEKYAPANYKVTFLTPDIAVMTHATKGTGAHNSMHVWMRKAGKWQVVATSTTPVKSAPASR
jgi:Domain of unknown function (DUF4440)